MQLIKYDQSPSTSTDGSPEMSMDSSRSPGIHDLFATSTERASNSSNVSESLNSDHSPEHDLSPLARRRARVSRAHRQRIVRSEYFTPAMANSLALQGRSQSLDAKEFIREVVQIHRPEENIGPVSSSSSMTLLNELSPIGSRDLGRERKLSNDVSRTLSFSVARDAQTSPVHVRRKCSDNRSRKPPDYNPDKLSGNSSPVAMKSDNNKVEAGNVTLVKRKSGHFKMEASKVKEVNGENINGKKIESVEVEETQRGEISEKQFPCIKRTSVNSDMQATAGNSGLNKNVNNVGATSGLMSRSLKHDDSSSTTRRVSESSRKSSDCSSLHSRTSSFTETTVRHVGSTSSAGVGETVERRHLVNGGFNNDVTKIQVRNIYIR